MHDETNFEIVEEMDNLADTIAEFDDCEIMDDDWTTEDGNRFYQNGKLILDASDMNDKQMARAAALIMKSQQYWPNVWFISDHGNVHGFTF